jgi:hypothetical protein
MQVEIIDNFLTRSEFKELQQFFMSDNFPWFFIPYVNDKTSKEIENVETFQFIHNFYSSCFPASDYIRILNPIISKLNPRALIRIKANLLLRTEKRIDFDFHIDQEISCKSAVFYVNSNNGKTLIKDYGEIESIENRLIIFDSKLEHTGTTCTDQKTRVVINFNYI